MSLNESSITDIQFVGYVVSSITGDPYCFDIEKSIDERGVLLRLNVSPDHIGRVIGRSGETANSLRGLLRALGVRDNARYSLLVRKRDG